MIDVIVSYAIAGTLGFLVIMIGTRRLPASEAAWLTRVLTLALILRLLMAGVFATIPESRVFHEDADGYEYYGQQLALSWKGVAVPFVPSPGPQNYGFLYVSAAIYYVFGQVGPLVSCINAVFGVGTILLVYGIARSFFHPLVARRAALLSSLMPSMILLSAVAMKDALVTLLIMLSLSFSLSLKRRFSITAMLGLIGALLAIQPLRFYMLYFVGFAVLLSLVLERGTRVLSGVYKQIVVGGVFIMFLIFVGLSGGAETGIEIMTLSRMSQFRHGMAISANSGFDAGADISTPERALAFLPLGLAELLLGPFPWQFGSLRALLAAPETFYWWVLFPSMLRGLWWMVRKRFAEVSPLIIFTGTLSCAYSLVHGNIGAAFRQRAQIFVVLFIFAALGYYQKRCRHVGLDPNLLLADGAAPPPVRNDATMPPTRRGHGSMQKTGLARSARQRE